MGELDDGFMGLAPCKLQPAELEQNSKEAMDELEATVMHGPNLLWIPILVIRK